MVVKLHLLVNMSAVLTIAVTNATGRIPVHLCGVVPAELWLMPMLHSENPAVLQRAIPLLRTLVDQATADLAQRNLQQLQRFGRYPWRDRARGSEHYHP